LIKKLFFSIVNALQDIMMTAQNINLFALQKKFCEQASWNHL